MATVQRTTPYGAFLDLGDGTTALLHVSSMANPDNLDNPQPRQLVKDGEKLSVRPLDWQLLTPAPFPPPTARSALQQQPPALARAASSACGQRALRPFRRSRHAIPNTSATHPKRKLLQFQSPLQ